MFSLSFSSTQADQWSEEHIQRPGLLYAGNYVYAAFSMMDGTSLPNGGVFGYNVANLSATPLYFPTAPDLHNGVGGGVWQGGGGLAYGPDENGANHIYFNTGNGPWDASTNWSDSFIELNPTTLTMPTYGYFTPSDEYYRACISPTYTDLDFGSGGVILTPSNSYWPYLALSGEKEGGLWAIDRLSPGTFNIGGCSNNCNLNCSPANQVASVQTVWLGNGTGPEIHNDPAYWNNFVYLAPASSTLNQYQICNNYGGNGAVPFCNNSSIPVATDPASNQVSTAFGMTPSVSANGTTNGVLWALKEDGSAESTNPGVLYAFDATSMLGKYASSGPGSNCAADQIAAPAKFAVPTVANGYVYIGTQQLLCNGSNCTNDGTGTFYIFGLNRQC